HLFQPLTFKYIGHFIEDQVNTFFQRCYVLRFGQLVLCPVIVIQYFHHGRHHILTRALNDIAYLFGSTLTVIIKLSSQSCTFITPVLLVTFHSFFLYVLLIAIASCSLRFRGLCFRFHLFV